MRNFLLGAACLAASTSAIGKPTGGRVVFENDRVRVWRVSSARELPGHPSAVVVPLGDGATRKAGEAYWSADEAARLNGEADERGPLVIVEPKASASPVPAAPAAATGTKPGEQPFTGMSFRPLFENERVAVIRARMEVGATEGFHTHASDMVIVHLSGGAIEDTAEWRTQVKRWKHGDVEFEGRGSSHSARNVGPPVDVVLVRLKP